MTKYDLRVRTGGNRPRHSVALTTSRYPTMASRCRHRIAPAGAQTSGLPGDSIMPPVLPLGGSLHLPLPNRPRDSFNRVMADHAATPDPPDDVPGSPASGTAELARLFREHNASLVQLLRARLRLAQEAWDVAQEAYVRMLQLDRLRSEGHTPELPSLTSISLTIYSF